MIIQPNSPADSAAQLAQTATPHRHSAPTSQTSQDAAAQRWSQLAIADTDGDPTMDAAGADKLMGQLTQSMFDTTSQAQVAQSGLDPQSVLELLQ